MTSLVLDASVTMAWCFREEATDYADSVFERVREAGAAVPGVWPLELANVLVFGERRGRLTRADTARFVQVIDSLPITVHAEAIASALGQVLELAREHGLSSYDAAYLALAMRLGLSLATLDARLGAAATRAGVSLVQ